MDMSCCTTTAPYWLMYSLHCGEGKHFNKQHFKGLHVNNKSIIREYNLQTNHISQALSQQVTLALNVSDESVNK